MHGFHRVMRREFLNSVSSIVAMSAVPGLADAQERQRFSRPDDHHATGRNGAVASTSREASESAMWALSQGGNAADAYMTVALTQIVVEHGLTSIAGGYSINYFDAATGEINSVLGPLGPAEAESYDFKRGSAVTQTGRAMPVPGFVSGLHASHTQFGKLKWSQLFESAIRNANDGFPVAPLLASAASSKAARFDDGKALWMKQGRLLRPGEMLVQKDLGRTLKLVSTEGPEYFYTGKFADNYVRRAAADGGKISMRDMADWKELSRSRKVQLEGNYRGYQIAAGGLVTYALHLNEALDLKSFGPAKDNPESLFRQYRIMEEVFLSSPDYSKETHSQFVSPDYARQRADAETDV